MPTIPTDEDPSRTSGVKKFFVLTVLLSCVLFSGTQASAGNFDGKWSIRTTTKAGNCGASKPAVLSVRNGKISGWITGQNGRYQMSGKISDKGSVKIYLSGGSASFSGMIAGRSGSGSWRGRGNCSGAFTLRKK